MTSVLNRIALPNWRLVLAAFFSMMILHILATFATPDMSGRSAVERLAAKLPLNQMVVLPPIAPRAQPAPFMGPEFRLAMCRFDTLTSPVALSAGLPAPGWSLSLYDADGGTIFTAAADPGRRSDVSLLLVPDDERFMGLTPEARGEQTVETGVLRVPAQRGIAVLRAPDSGVAYAVRHEEELRRATCRAQPG